jgi:hypothetical protein
MSGSNSDWLAPLTGVAFFVILIVGFAISGEPKSADDPVEEIVEFWVDNKDSVMIGSILAAIAGTFLIFFGAYLRKVLRAAGGEGETLSLVSFVGLVLVALGIAIDATISFALAEAADDIDPTAVQALQALWDNDFIPIALGVLAFIWATAISVIRTGVLPKWLGWVLIPFGIAGVTPIGFVSAAAAAIWILGVSILLTLRARSGPSAPTPAAPTPAA